MKTVITGRNFSKCFGIVCVSFALIASNSFGSDHLFRGDAGENVSTRTVNFPAGNYLVELQFFDSCSPDLYSIDREVIHGFAGDHVRVAFGARITDDLARPQVCRPGMSRGYAFINVDGSSNQIAVKGTERVKKDEIKIKVSRITSKKLVTQAQISNNAPVEIKQNGIYVAHLQGPGECLNAFYNASMRYTHKFNSSSTPSEIALFVEPTEATQTIKHSTIACHENPRLSSNVVFEITKLTPEVKFNLFSEINRSKSIQFDHVVIERITGLQLIE